MHQSKLIQTLKILNTAELRRFGEYVHSPYFNKHDNTTRLCEVLLEEAPKFESPRLERETLYKELFPDGPYKMQRLNDVFTYLYRLLEGFLQQNVHDNRSREHALHLAQAFSERKLDKHFENAYQQAVKDNGLSGVLYEEMLLHHYFAEDLSDRHFISRDSRTQDKSIERKAHWLDAFYLTAKLRNTCEMLNRQNIVKQDYQIDHLNEVLQMVTVDDAKQLQFPAIGIYYRIAMTLRDSANEEHYHKLVALLAEHSSIFPEVEVRTMYDYAQNYCIKKINTGKGEYLRELFGLYQILLERGIILVDQELSQWDYKNIVTVATRLGEHAWAEQFLNQYKEKLPIADRENAHTYNLANLYYSIRQYGKALELLRDVQFTDIYYGLGARSLLLKVYYEAGEYDPLYSLVDSFSVYLKRNELVSPYQYTAHMNLVRFAKRVADLKLRSFGGNHEALKKDIEKLLKRMSMAGDITNANWLKEQLGVMVIG
ncbi:hypothetical protein BH09BAC1_BH09BAC1_23510 [soil metagenome]